MTLIGFNSVAELWVGVHKQRLVGCISDRMVVSSRLVVQVLLLGGKVTKVRRIVTCFCQ